MSKTHDQYLYEQGMKFLNSGNLEEALSMFNAGIQAYPTDPYFYNARGKVFELSLLLYPAIDDFTKVITLDRNFVEAYVNRSCMFGKLGLHQKAIDDCTTAISIDPNCAEAYRNRHASRLQMVISGDLKLTESESIEHGLKMRSDLEKCAKIYEMRGDKQSAAQLNEFLNTAKNSRLQNIQTEKSSECFVATATFGTPYEPEVIRYRNFRDKYLVKYFLGRIFIRVYYNYLGKKLAKLINYNYVLKQFSLFFLRSL